MAHTSEFCTFYLDNLLFGVELKGVQEVIRSLDMTKALVHLSDLLCRMRGLGYGYYERHKVDLIADPAWAILLKEHRELEGVDLVRFTFELDEAVEDIEMLVATV